MKTVRHDFSLEKYNSDKYRVVTRDGRSVRLLCTDFCQTEDNKFNIIGLIKYKNNGEYVQSFKDNGDAAKCYETEDDLLLEEQVFEDGDIVTNEKDIAIYKDKDKCYCGISEQGCLAIDAFFYYKVITRLATEEEKKKLFNALVKEGKSWNADMKRIEDIVPKCELKPFDRVLVRDGNDREWMCNIFSNFCSSSDFPYECLFEEWKQCIPYEGNEELLGTNKTPIK